MSTIITNKIISQAISLGFDFEQFDNETDLKEVSQVIYDFFNEKSDKLPTLEDECEVSNHGYSQTVSYRDYVSSGQIVSFSENWHNSPDTKVYHSDFIMVDKDGLIKNMRLYYLVGETDYNAPEGYWYNPKTKSHEIFED